MKPSLLIETTRGKVIEKQHFGFILGVDTQENIFLKAGNSENRNFWLRSAAKPLQASVIIQTEAYEKFNFTLEELAVCCASHMGTEEHTKTVKSILDKIGLKESDLQCGIHEPIDTETKNSLIRNNIAPNQLHNNCSGKHAGMLATCVAKNWDTKNYLDFDHPLQKQIIKSIANFCNYDEKQIDIGRDGCSAPVHALPFSKMGIGFLNLFSDKKYEKIKQAFQQNPYLIGGHKRLDSEIIMASSGRLICKTAAGGLCITVNPEKQRALIVKILDADMAARTIAVINALKQLQWLSEDEINSHDIKNLFDLDVKNLKNEIVGKIIPKTINNL